MKRMRLGGLWMILCSACSGPGPDSTFTQSSGGEEVNKILDKSDLPIKSYRIKDVDHSRKMLVSGLSCDTYVLNKIKGGSLQVYKLVGNNCTQSDEEKQLDLADDLGVGKEEKFIVINTIN